MRSLAGLAGFSPGFVGKPPVPAFDPGTLAPDGLWLPSYDNSGAVNKAWLPRAGSGGSGANGNLSTQGGITVAPTVGAAINGPNTSPAIFDGTASLPTDNVYTTFVTDVLGTAVVFFLSTALGTSGTHATADHGQLFTTGNDNMIMAHSVGGVRACANGFQDTPFVPLAANVFAMAALRWNNVNVDLRVCQPGSTTDVTHTMLASFGNVGKLYPGGRSAGLGLVGQQRAVGLWKRRLTDAELVSLASYGSVTFGTTIG